jgi:hypothetical protein
MGSEVVPSGRLAGKNAIVTGAGGYVYLFLLPRLQLAILSDICQSRPFTD